MALYGGSVLSAARIALSSKLHITVTSSVSRRGEVFQIAQIQTELYFVLCRITIFCVQQRIQQRVMGVDYRRSAGAVTPATSKNPQPCGWGFLCRWWGSNPHGITTNGF